MTTSNSPSTGRSPSSSARTARGNRRCWKRSPTSPASTRRAAARATGRWIIRAHWKRRARRSAKALRASWLPKLTNGWFFRAESFFTVARYLDEAAQEPFGGPPPDFLSHSHGEGFLRFFAERCHRQGLFIFDEPEAALSPSRQIEFLKLLRRIEQSGIVQVIMATHAPMLMAYPRCATPPAHARRPGAGLGRGDRPLPPDARILGRPGRVHRGAAGGGVGGRDGGALPPPGSAFGLATLPALRGGGRGVCRELSAEPSPGGRVETAKPFRGGACDSRRIHPLPKVSRFARRFRPPLKGQGNRIWLEGMGELDS